MRRCGIFFILLMLTCFTLSALHAQDATVTPRPTLLRQPTHTPRPINVPTVTLQAELLPPAPTVHAPSLFTDTPAPRPTVALATSAPSFAAIGTSVRGLPLEAWRFGSGERVLLLVGGIHGGWEANTVTLMRQLISYFTARPQDIPPSTSLIIIPAANPDGFALGRVWQGRFNGNGVDLNRNWSCDWSSTAYWQQARVNPGVAPASEPEVQTLMAYILQVRPAAAFFYHSAANGVFAGTCGGDHGSTALSELLGRTAGYRFGASFTAYLVTGTASDWVNEQGIPSADVELITSYDSEYERNLRGVLALLAWLAQTSP